MYITKRNLSNFGPYAVGARMQREGSAFDATAFRNDGDAEPVDVKFESPFVGVPFNLLPALFGVRLGFSQRVITRFLSQAEVRLSDIGNLRPLHFEGSVITTDAGVEYCIEDLQRYLIEAMADCPVRAHDMIKELRTVNFDSDLVRHLLHCEVPDLWVSSRLGAEETVYMERLPRNIHANLRGYSGFLMDLPNQSVPDMLRRSGALKLQFIRKVFAFHEFYEDILISLRDKDGYAQRLVNKLQLLEQEEQVDFAWGLMNAVFIKDNDKINGKVGDSEDPRSLLQVMKVLVDEMELFVETETLTVALSFLPSCYIGKVDQVKHDQLYAALHDFDTVLERFCNELLELDPMAFTVAHFTAMSKLRNFHHEGFVRANLDKTKVLRHVASAVMAFKPFHCEVKTQKWDIDKLVVDAWRDFVDLFREPDFQLKVDEKEFFDGETIPMRMIGETSRHFPDLSDSDQQLLNRYWALEDAEIRV